MHLFFIGSRRAPTQEYGNAKVLDFFVNPPKRGSLMDQNQQLTEAPAARTVTAQVQWQTLPAEQGANAYQARGEEDIQT